MKLSFIKRLPMAVAAAAMMVAAVPEGTPVFGETAQALQQQNTQGKKKTRKVPAMSQGIYKQMQAAQDAIEIKDYAEAESIIAELISKKKINDYELATVWQLKAGLAYDKGDVKGTISGFEKVLTFANSIPEAQEHAIMFNLAQLHFSEENYDQSLNYIKRWEAVTPMVSITQMVFIGQLQYVRSDFESALQYIYRAIGEAETIDTVEVQESWYGLAMSAHWEMSQYSKVRDVLEILLINWPKPHYWTQLAAVYGELGEEETSFSLTEAAYRAGYLDDKEMQLVNVAQILIARSAPIKATWVLEKAFKEERVEESARNLRTLGQAYMMASEYERAIAPLQKSAAKGADGDLWFQIAQVQMQLDQHADAIESFDKAIAELGKGKVSKKDEEKILTAHMQIGTANTELKKFAAAKRSFAAAKRLSKSQKQRRTVTQWENYLKGEEAREKMLRGDG